MLRLLIDFVALTLSYGINIYASNIPTIGPEKITRHIDVLENLFSTPTFVITTALYNKDVNQRPNMNRIIHASGEEGPNMPSEKVITI